jgi:hypothetical protein
MRISIGAHGHLRFAKVCLAFGVTTVLRVQAVIHRAAYAGAYRVAKTANAWL